ncbi:MAG: hypothetical protein KatS3mg031_0941 [Chitinophagales bacterium]|nr:MAG: hypothetical protein KatS3mg031_0941 [Chitinophagales bacterium]
MVIKRYGIRLIRLREADIETVRQWRNAPHIRNFMEYREYITPAMQQKWFRSLDAVRDFYFIIEYRDKPVGLIHTSGICWESGTGHSGLFIWEKHLQGSPVPVLASLSMVDFFFLSCRLHRLYAKIMKANKVAIKYNQRLGFRPIPDDSESNFQQYVLEKDHYLQASAPLHAMARAFGNEKPELHIENDLLLLLKQQDAFLPSGLTLMVVN